MAILGLWTCFAVLVLAASGHEPIHDDATLRDFLSKTKAELYPLYEQMLSPDILTGKEGAWQKLEDRITLIHESYAPIYEVMKSVDLSSIENADLKQAVGLWTRFRNDQITLQERIAYVKTPLYLILMAYRTTFCDFHDQEKCDLTYATGVMQHILMTEDPQELIYYWKQWREHITDEDVQNLVALAESYRNIVKREGFPVSSLWYFRFGMNFMSQIDIVKDEIIPFYKQLHAYLRFKLREKYGEQNMAASGPIPEYYMDQIFAQATSPEIPVGFPYPEEHFNLTRVLIEKGFDGHKSLETANYFYNSMGLADLPSDYLENNIEMLSTEQCMWPRLTLPSQQTKLPVCPKMNLYAFIQSFETMMDIRYKKQSEHLPLIMDWEACPGFITALSIPAKLSVLTPEYLTKIGLMEGDVVDGKFEINRLYRAAIFAFLGLPKLIAHEKIWIQLVESESPKEIMNDLYKATMLEIAGIQVGPQLEEEKSVLSYDFLKGLLAFKPQVGELFAELMGYKFYEALCEKTEIFDPEDQTSYLKDCNLYGQASIGAELNKMMSLGSTKPWTDIVEPLIGEKTLTASGILKYFEPLKLWLEAENDKHNEPIGW